MPKLPGGVAQSVGHLTRMSGVLGSILYLATSFCFLRRAVVSYWRKYVHEALVHRLGGLSLPRKSVVRLTDRPDMMLDVYRGCKTTIQQIQHAKIQPKTSSGSGEEAEFVIFAIFSNILDIQPNPILQF